MFRFMTSNYDVVVDAQFHKLYRSVARFLSHRLRKRWAMGERWCRTEACLCGQSRYRQPFCRWEEGGVAVLRSMYGNIELAIYQI